MLPVNAYREPTHFVVHGREDCIVQTLAVGFRHRVREMRHGMAECVGFTGHVSDGLALRDGLFQEEARRHELVFFALLHHFDDLVERQGNLVKPGEIVFILLGRVEWNDRHKLRELKVRAVELLDRHLVSFEVNRFQALLQTADHQTLAQFFLFRKSGYIERVKFR